MADSWYYARDDKRNGPYSSRQLRDLADAGSILTTDTVWKTGVELGVLASKVKHLFPLAEVRPLEIVSIPPTQLPRVTAPPLVESIHSDPVSAPLIEPEQPRTAVSAPTAPKTPTNEPPARQRIATGGQGAIVMGQDGTQVKFKKQCTTCKTIDSSWTTMKITPGPMKAGFYCPKCRRRRDVELRGS